MMTSREFKALEDGKIITKISIYGYEGNLLKTTSLDQANIHKCVMNQDCKRSYNKRSYNFTIEEAKHYIQLGIADNYVPVHNTDGTILDYVHAIRYIDLAYGKLTRQRKLKELGLKSLD